jgi:hypothetical protein
LPWEIEAIVNEHLATERYQKCKSEFRDAVSDFVKKNITDKLVTLRTKYDLNPALKKVARLKKGIE